MTRVLNIIHDASILFLTWHRTKGRFRDIASMAEAKSNVVTKMLLNGLCVVHPDSCLGISSLVDTDTRCHLLRASPPDCPERPTVMMRVGCDCRVHLVLNIVDAVLTVTGASIPISSILSAFAHIFWIYIKIFDDTSIFTALSVSRTNDILLWLTCLVFFQIHTAHPLLFLPDPSQGSSR